MKCRVCGYEFNNERAYCPMCGARAKDPSVQITEEEMKWNTRDFPTPQEPRDIPMQWSSPDASEGYFSTPYPKPSAEPSQYSKPYTKDPIAARVPRQEEGRLPEKFNTFVSKNDEFQRLLDKEFERLEGIKVEAPVYKKEDTRPIPQVNLNYPAKPSKTDRFDIDAIEDKIEEIVAEEAKAQAESSERKRRLAAMAAARDAYFKSLDEGIFEEKPSKRPSKYDPSPKYETSPKYDSLPEKDEDYFDASYREAQRKPAPEKREVVPEKAFNSSRERTKNIQAEEFSRSQHYYDENRQYSVEFGKESHFEIPKQFAEDEYDEFKLENIIKAQANREEPVSKFEEPVPKFEEPTPKFEEPTPRIRESSKPAWLTKHEEPKIEEAPKPAQVEQPKEPEIEEAPQRVEDFVEKLEPSSEHTMKFDKLAFIAAEQKSEEEDAKAEELRREKLTEILNEGNAKYDLRVREKEERNQKAQAELDRIYREAKEADEQNEEKKTHPILGFIITILVIALILEVAVFALGKFLPDAEFTKAAIDLNNAVIATVVDFFTNLWTKITELFGTAKAFVLRVVNK